MPRKSRGVKARLAAEVPLDLGNRIEALRAPYGEWLTKALFVEKALEYYCDAAERIGIEQLPPFKPTKPSCTKQMQISGRDGASQAEHQTIQP